MVLIQNFWKLSFLVFIRKYCLEISYYTDYQYKTEAKRFGSHGRRIKIVFKLIGVEWTERGHLKNSFFNHTKISQRPQRKALCDLCGFRFVIFAVKTIDHKGKARWFSYYIRESY
jgi:hypothetical protein